MIHPLLLPCKRIIELTSESTHVIVMIHPLLPLDLSDDEGFREDAIGIITIFIYELWLFFGELY